jgi:hypothetical protein
MLARRLAAVVTLVLCAVSMTGCTAMQDNPRTTEGVALATLAGAAAGAGLDALAGGGQGAAIGGRGRNRRVEITIEPSESLRGEAA